MELNISSKLKMIPLSLIITNLAEPTEKNVGTHRGVSNVHPHFFEFYLFYFFQLKLKINHCLLHGQVFVMQHKKVL